ncbi:MAG: hypothetical protein IJ853_04340 [Rickettsiales bacterium]|nr:hypothetical protein [Rickettsiales bacterium]
MLLDTIEKQDSKILILGINNISLALINYLVDNEITVVAGDYDETLENISFTNGKAFDIVDLDKINFNSFEYIVLAKNILMEKDKLEVLLARLDNVASKVYLDIEFVSMLFQRNKYIGIIGSNYNFITASILNNIFDNAGVKNIDFSNNNINENVEDDSHSTNINFEDVICFSALQSHKMKYLKKDAFDVLAILDCDFCLDNKDYIDSFKKYLINNDRGSILILNIDDDTVYSIYEDLYKNNDNNSRIIPISINKMLNNGFSYINGTLYNYFVENNESYDITANDAFIGDIQKTSLLCSSVVAIESNIDVETINETVKNFNGVTNCLEFVGQVDNIKFINNVGATTEKILYTPFDIYNNIYTIFLVNDKQHDELSHLKYLTKKSKNTFFVDVCGLLDLTKVYSRTDTPKYNNLKELFEFLLEEIYNSDDKEEEVTVLLSAIVDDEMNNTYYCDYANEYKKLIKGLK